MTSVREITVFSNGDSGRLSTWSNVPYFFTETLLAKGIKVNRVDLSPDPALETLWDGTMGRVVQRLLPSNSEYNYFRSKTHFKNVKRRIRKALQQFPGADVNLFLTFSFSSAGMTHKPTVLFCDWTYDHLFKYYAGRKPAFLEKQCLKRENAQIEQADLVLPLYPGVAVYMKNTYGNKNIHYLGNVINSVYEANEQEALQAKRNSFALLFVGGAKYLAGAKALSEAFRGLKKDFPDLKLDFVGINEADIGALPRDAVCHGYLDKGNDAQRLLYYDLFRRATIFINTTPKWGAFSATIEAMYHYIPVIVSPYDEFTETFGKQIEFGKYCSDNSPSAIEQRIREILSDPSYSQLCMRAHEAVKDYTWSAYVDRVVTEINVLLK